MGAKKTIATLFIAGWVSACTGLNGGMAGGEDAQASTSIFNGTNFDGWVVPANNTWWTVENGVLHCKSGPKRKGTDLLTEKSYKNFVAEFDFKMGEGTIDSGFYIRSIKQQIQLGISGSLKRDMTGSLYVPKHGYPGKASNTDEVLSRFGWNTLKVKAVGNQYTVWLNGKQVLDYTSETAFEQGPVGFQLHGNRNMAIDFKNIKITEING